VEDYLERSQLLLLSGSSPLDDTPRRGRSSLLLRLSTGARSRRSEGKHSSTAGLEELEQSTTRDNDNDTSIMTPVLRSQRTILMENQLDLNETEMEYYEQIVNDLAGPYCGTLLYSDAHDSPVLTRRCIEKLERMKEEKEEIQAISSMLGDRLLKITYE